LLDDALDAFLDSVGERAFDEPLMALVRSQGYTDVHLVHGNREFGRDVIGKRDEEQWGWQSKAGDIGQGEWRDIVGQLDELRLVNLGHGSFDVDLPRRPVLVTTGRLKGNAPDLYRDYNERAEKAGEPRLGLWDKDVLLGMLSGNPDAVLRRSVDGQLLTALGSIDEKTASMASLEVFARRWSAWEPERLATLGVIEVGLLCDRLAAAQRLDLAAHLALCLIASAWAAAGGDPGKTPAASAGAKLFKTYALHLWEEADDRLLREKGLVGYSGPSAWVTYPLRCVRVAEILGLLALLCDDPGASDDGDPRLEEIAKWLALFVDAQPGASHPISDNYAVGVIPATLAIARSNATAAEAHLRATAVWLADRYEPTELGLAGVGAQPAEEISRLLGGSFESGLDRRPSSLLASVILDLCAALRLGALYEDVYNDVEAVRVHPETLRLATGADAFLATGHENRLDPHVDYAESFTAAPLAPHHGDAAATEAIAAGRTWELLAVSAALRDRVFFAAVEAMGQGEASPGDSAGDA